MSRSYQIPGGVYVTETATRQYQLPGAVFIAETVSVGGAAAPKLAPEWIALAPLGNLGSGMGLQ